MAVHKQLWIQTRLRGGINKSPLLEFPHEQFSHRSDKRNVCKEKQQTVLRSLGNIFQTSAPPYIKQHHGRTNLSQCLHPLHSAQALSLTTLSHFYILFVYLYFCSRGNESFLPLTWNPLTHPFLRNKDLLFRTSIHTSLQGGGFFSQHYWRGHLWGTVLLEKVLGLICNLTRVSSTAPASATHLPVFIRFNPSCSNKTLIPNKHTSETFQLF